MYLLMMALIAATAALGGVSAADLPYEFRGVWVATVDNIDWPTTKTLTTDQQQAELIAILDRAKELRLNAVVFQIRPSADALYRSSIEPWSEYLTGQNGKAPDPEWDPMEFAVAEAHKRGLELHAWFNPYRAQHFVAKSQPSESHIINTHPLSAPKYGRYYWMDPTDPFVQKRSKDVILDVVKRYDLDGVHIDDYFYPYPEKGSDGKTLDFPDQANYDAYLAGGGKLSRGDWRRKAVDDFVHDLYSGIKKAKQWVKFGISPFGIWRPGYPETIKAGIDQYDTLYADCKKWLNEGWCDYFTPQLYWKISKKEQSYPVLLKWWLSENSKNRHMWIGNYSGQVLESGWDTQEIVDQIGITREQRAGGNIFFSMKAFMRNTKGINDDLKSKCYPDVALVPPSPWLGKTAPARPVVQESSYDAGNLTVTLKASAKDRFWVFCQQNKVLALVPSDQEQATFAAPAGGAPIEVAAVSKSGVVGPFVTVVK